MNSTGVNVLGNHVDCTGNAKYPGSNYKCKQIWGHVGCFRQQLWLVSSPALLFAPFCGVVTEKPVSAGDHQTCLKLEDDHDSCKTELRCSSVGSVGFFASEAKMMTGTM